MSEDPVLSIHPKYADAIFAGLKRVEFRRKRISLSKSRRIWVYATRPVAGVIGYIEVKEVVCKPLDELWDLYSSVGHIDAGEFNGYFSGCETGYALVLSDAVLLDTPLGLDKIMQVCPTFRPPQFYLRSAPTALADLLPDPLY